MDTGNSQSVGRFNQMFFQKDIYSTLQCSCLFFVIRGHWPCVCVVGGVMFFFPVRQLYLAFDQSKTAAITQPHVRGIVLWPTHTQIRSSTVTSHSALSCRQTDRQSVCCSHTQCGGVCVSHILSGRDKLNLKTKVKWVYVTEHYVKFLCDVVVTGFSLGYHGHRAFCQLWVYHSRCVHLKKVDPTHITRYTTC